jgi:hypothetical protein
MPDIVSQIVFGLVVLGLLVWAVVRTAEGNGGTLLTPEFLRWWRGQTRLAKLFFFAVAMWSTLCTGKGPHPASGLFRMLFWHGGDWALALAYDSNDAAASAVSASVAVINAATNTSATVVGHVETNDVVTYSFDWHAPNRLPHHDRQNVLGRTVWVQPTNIAGRLYEDHYVAFNEQAATNPAVILIEYARKHDDGAVERYTSEVVTNSYPDMTVIELQSGTHTSYWFRCLVPTAFTNCCVRDWNGEALFGSPEGSGRGFDLMGLLLVDDGDNIWEGATTNIVEGGVTYPVRNGIIGGPEDEE